MKLLVPLLIAAVLGVVAVVVGKKMLDEREPAAVASSGTVAAAVVVAQRDVPAGAMLKTEDLRLAKFPEGSVPRTAFAKVADVAGRVVVTPLVKDQTVLESALAPVGAGRGLQALIPEGMRAVTIQVNEMTGVAGLLLPGCRVDVVGTYRDEASNHLIAKTVVENVEVTAVGPNLEVPETQGQTKGAVTRSVTLLASVQDAEKIELAAFKGRPRLVLRGGGDAAPVASLGVTYSELLGPHPALLAHLQPEPPVVEEVKPEPEPEPVVEEVKPEPPVAPAVVRREVQVIRSGRASQVSFVFAPDGMGAGSVAEGTPEPEVGPQSDAGNGLFEPVTEPQPTTRVD